MSTLLCNVVSLLYVFVIDHHKPMVLYLGGPTCQSLHELESCPDSGTDRSKKTGQLSISCSDWQGESPLYRAIGL